MKPLVRVGRHALIVTVALGLAACSDSSTGPSFPDVTGTYTGTWTLTAEPLAGGTPNSVTCNGSVAISQQSEGAISGSFDLQSDGGDCDDLSASGGIAGSVQSDGGVGFELSVPGQDQNGFDAIISSSCTFVSGDTGLSGSVNNGTMNVSASNVFECGNDEFRVNYQFVGS